MKRNFLSRLLLVVLAGLFMVACAAPEKKQQKLTDFGLILGNTGGDWYRNDPKAALIYLAQLGFTQLEGIDTLPGMSMVETKAFLDSLGLKPVLGGTSMQAFKSEDTTALMNDIRRTKAFGQEYIVCYWPWTEDKPERTMADWKEVAHYLNRGGEICKANGLKLLYHNHDIEFFETEGQIPFDMLMSEVNPEFCAIELDLYWTVKGNADPIEVIKKYPGRFKAFHVKDMDATEARDFADVGQGIIDFPAIFAYSDLAGVELYSVEHDRPVDNKVCVERAAEYLKNVTF